MKRLTLFAALSIALAALTFGSPLAYSQEKTSEDQ